MLLYAFICFCSFCVVLNQHIYRYMFLYVLHGPLRGQAGQPAAARSDPFKFSYPFTLLGTRLRHFIVF